MDLNEQKLQCSASTQSQALIGHYAVMVAFSAKLTVLISGAQQCFKTLILFVLWIFKSVITNFGYTLI